jgi:predicted Rossmann fold nucleotide-binding protein DprA/Smf involved in DNA uptake
MASSSDLLSKICDELDARLRELRPLLDEYESLLDAVAALEPAVDASTEAGSSPRAAKKPTPRRTAAAPKRAQRGAAAILAALEHGSHTVSELAVVTAMSGQIVNSNLRRLRQAGTITRTKRAGDGKAAYTLAAMSA